MSAHTSRPAIIHIHKQALSATATPKLQECLDPHSHKVRLAVVVLVLILLQVLYTSRPVKTSSLCRDNRIRRRSEVFGERTHLEDEKRPLMTLVRRLSPRPAKPTPTPSAPRTSVASPIASALTTPRHVSDAPEPKPQAASHDPCGTRPFRKSVPGKVRHPNPFRATFGPKSTS